MHSRSAQRTARYHQRHWDMTEATVEALYNFAHPGRASAAFPALCNANPKGKRHHRRHARRKERGLSSTPCPFNTHRPVKTSATGRARSKLECCAYPPKTASAGAPEPRETRGAGLALEPQLASRTTGAYNVERPIAEAVPFCTP